MYSSTTTYQKVMLWFVMSIMCMFNCACSQKSGKALPTFEIKRVAYEDILIVEGHTESVNPLNINCPPDVDGTIVNMIESGTKVKKGDTLCILEDANIENNVDRWLLDLEGMYAEMEKLKATQHLEYALLEAQVRNNEAETLLADYDSLQMLYMSPMDRRVKELQLERARIERTQLLKKLEVTKIVQQTDVMKLSKRIEWMERQLEKELQKKESLILLAPRDGVAVRARRWAWSDVKWVVGDNVWNGRTIVTLPDFDNMKVLIYAQETEYKRLHEGDSITYTFDAMPNNFAWGHITKLSPVGQTRTEGSTVKTFEIEASIDSMLTSVDPGMSAQCRIFLRHIPDTIVVPTVSIFEKDSLKVVYVEQRAGHYEERSVKLGESSPRSTVITNGLKVGEKITLIRPQNN